MLEKRPIELPSEPTGDDFEHLAASVFSVCGCFVEKNITEKVAKREIQELDVVATRWGPDNELRILAEAKSGTWGTSVLFSLLGRVHYLALNKAILLHSAPPEDPERQKIVADRFQEHNIAIHQLSSGEPNDDLWRFLAEFCSQSRDEIDRRLKKTFSLEAWRYSFWMEKALIKALVKHAKARHDKARVLVEAREVVDEINKRFFMPDCRDQSSGLYSSYMQRSALTRRAIEEKLAKAPGKDLKGLTEEQAFEKCVYEGCVPAVQACMYLEHRTRCLILKAAVDMICHSRQGTLPEALIFGIPKETMLPKKFKDFVASHSDNNWVQLYPQLWQSYIFTWGGFLMTDRLDEEYKNIALDTGLPMEEVERGLRAFDELFTIENNEWHYEQKNTVIRILKVTPGPFRGLGVQRRRWIYGENLLDTLPFLTREDFACWSHVGYELLADDHA